ncbi:MAG: hypothetical protein U1F08_09090 [Steroidobacteraceae bacterium]
MSGLRPVAVATLAVLAAGCGYKGPLTLPPKSGPVVTRPATTPAPAPATAPATGDPAPAGGTGDAVPPSSGTTTPPAGGGA